jgi:hypothetical protein
MSAWLEQRLARVNMLQDEAQRLLLAARHDSLQHHVHLALRDLRKALVYLSREGVATRSRGRTTIDAVADIASARLNSVRRTLDLRGTDAIVW